MDGLTASERAAGWRVLALDRDVAVAVAAAPDPPEAAVEREVGRIWADACAANPSLFDGQVFCAGTIAPARIAGWWTPYRYAFAQIREPALFEALRVRSLAVNGIVRSPDGIVLGRRAAASIYQGGLWQCPPAGSVERRGAGSDGATTVDLVAQVLAELEEELGVPAGAVGPARVIGAVEHAASHVVDVGIALDTSWSAARITDAHAARGNREYDRLAIVPVEELPEWLESERGRIVPTARAFLASPASLASLVPPAP